MPDPSAPPDAGSAQYSDLGRRVVSSIVMIPVALAAAYVGGPVFVAFWAIAALGVMWEWTTMVLGRNDRLVLAAPGVALVVAAGTLAGGQPASGIAVAVVGVIAGLAVAGARHRLWIAAGIAYAGLGLAVAPALVRADPALGFVAIVFLFAVVWLTDIGAYFAGRALGGPKLWPAVSPRKTWSGALGGTVAGILAGLAVAWLAGLGNLPAVAAIGLVLSIVSQAGDLLESAFKRRFGAKDASSLIPGHGGLMDRLDGFVTAAVAAAFIGITRGGFEASARGLLVW